MKTWRLHALLYVDAGMKLMYPINSPCCTTLQYNKNTVPHLHKLVLQLLLHYLDCLTVSRAIPVAECNLNLFIWRHRHALLLCWQRVWVYLCLYFQLWKDEQEEFSQAKTTVKYGSLRSECLLVIQIKAWIHYWIQVTTICLCLWMSWHSLLIFSCFSSHSCLSSSLRRFSSSWNRQGSENV